MKVITNKNVVNPKPDSFELIASATRKVARVTGVSLEGETIPNPNNTNEYYSLRATDLGIMWDATTDPDKKKIMIAFGDSYDDGWGGSGGGGDPEGWRGSILAFSENIDLENGLKITGMISEESNPTYAKEIIYSEHDVSGNGDHTAIPTAGVTVGNRHFMHYMQVRKWGKPGMWDTNFSEVAFSDDEGQNWTLSGVKWDAKSKFAQAAYVKADGFVYMFGTPSGRMESAYIARVLEQSMLELDQYEYWDGSEWVKGKEAVAASVVEAPVSELSVAYNSYYKQWIMVYLNEHRSAIVMRSSSSLIEGWSDEVVLLTGQDYPGLYGGFIHPWTNTGKDLYYLTSEWGPYNVFLMHSTLDIKQ